MFQLMNSRLNPGNRTRGIILPWLFFATVLSPGLLHAQPADVSVSPSSGTGMGGTLSFVTSSANGYGYIAQVYALLETHGVWGDQCYVQYWSASNQLWMMDAGGTWHSLTPNSPGTISNNQCTLNAGASSVAGSGTNLTVSLALTFNALWTGPKDTWLAALDQGGNSASWAQMGTWTVGSGSQITIAGHVRSGVCPLAQATVSISGGSNPTATGADGSYSFTVTGNSTYTVTPSKTGYTFTPNPGVFTVTTNSITNADFSATGPPIPTREYIRLGGRIVAVAECGSN